MRRIYLEIYLSVVGIALLAMLCLAFFSHWYFDSRLEARRNALEKIAGRNGCATSFRGRNARNNQKAISRVGK